MAEVESKEIERVDISETEVDHDPHYDPIISLPEVITSTNEEDESELIKLRAKLFRYDTNENPPEWKERGTGDVKLLRHQTKNTVRVVMRRDKTLKICANHYVTPYMELKPNCGSDRAWVWSVVADYTNETAQPELLAIRFANAENAKKWKDMFEEAKSIVATECELYTKDHNGSENEVESEESDEEEKIEESLQNLKLNQSEQEEKDVTKKESPESTKEKVDTAEKNKSQDSQEDNSLTKEIEVK